MKLEVELLHKEYESVLSGYAILLSFRMYNLCVKAHPVILLPVVVKVKGTEQKLEDIAQVGLRAEDQLDIYPSHEDLIVPIGQGIAELHPELKQSIEAIHVDEPEPKDFKYLRLTMPEVDKARHDLLLEGVDAYYEVAKGQLDVAKVKYVARMEKSIFGQPKEEVDVARGMFDETFNQHAEMVEKTVADKQTEIEEAYQRYLERRVQQEQSRLEQAAAQGLDVLNQMQMPGLS